MRASWTVLQWDHRETLSQLHGCWNSKADNWAPNSMNHTLIFYFLTRSCTNATASEQVIKQTWEHCQTLPQLRGSWHSKKKITERWTVWIIHSSFSFSHAAALGTELSKQLTVSRTRSALNIFNLSFLRVVTLLYLYTNKRKTSHWSLLWRQKSTCSDSIFIGKQWLSSSVIKQSSPKDHPLKCKELKFCDLFYALQEITNHTSVQCVVLCGLVI